MVHTCSTQQKHGIAMIHSFFSFNQANSVFVKLIVRVGFSTTSFNCTNVMLGFTITRDCCICAKLRVIKDVWVPCKNQRNTDVHKPSVQPLHVGGGQPLVTTGSFSQIYQKQKQNGTLHFFKSTFTYLWLYWGVTKQSFIHKLPMKHHR